MPHFASVALWRREFQKSSVPGNELQGYVDGEPARYRPIAGHHSPRHAGGGRWGATLSAASRPLRIMLPSSFRQNAPK
jgi:hypothetical protein